MKRKHTFVTLVVLAVFCLLVYLQVRTWKKFDWHTFWSRTDHVNPYYIAASVAVTYFLYLLRATRWSIFLRPVRRTTTAELVPSQFIGFTGLALLGRPGEMIRPYLVARKTRLTFSSQIAVWLVERLFDMGCVALMYIVAAFIGDPMWTWRLHSTGLQTRVEWSAELLLAVIIAICIFAFYLRRSGYSIARFLETKIGRYHAHWGDSISSKLKSFTDGLQTIDDFRSFAQLFGLSMVMWILVGVAYWLVTHAYGGALAELGSASILLLMVTSMFGSLIQLPGVGGGTQLATIATLTGVFQIEKELAVSCGILLWVATFMSVIPIGLLMAHREQISLRAVAEAEQKEEAALAE